MKDTRYDDDSPPPDDDNGFELPPQPSEFNPQPQTAPRTRFDDWYDSQLAELDAESPQPSAAQQPQLSLDDFDACMDAQDLGEVYDPTPTPPRRLRISEMRAGLAAKNRGEAYTPPPDVWEEVARADGVVLRRQVLPPPDPRVEKYRRQLDECKKRMAEPMEPPQEPRTKAEAEAWDAYAALMNSGTRRTYTLEEADQHAADIGAAFKRYNEERARTDANGSVIEGGAYDQRLAGILAENEALREAALTLPSDPRRAARIAKYESIKKANTEYVAAPIRGASCNSAGHGETTRET